MLYPQQTAQRLDCLDSRPVLSISKWIRKSISVRHCLTSVTAPPPNLRYIQGSLLKQNRYLTLTSHQPLVYFCLIFSGIFLKHTVCAGCRLILTTPSHCNLASHPQSTETLLQAAISAFCYQPRQRAPSPYTWRSLALPPVPLKSLLRLPACP